MAEEVQHVLVEGEGEKAAAPEAISDSAAVAVATAGAAAALAQETAAHAELQAAEEVAEVEQEVDAWKAATATQIENVGTALASLSERLDALHSERQASEAAQAALLERLLVLEEAELSRSSIPSSSDEAAAVEPEARTEAAPIVGTEAAANLGPLEVGGQISSEVTKREPPNPNSGARPRVLRRWI